MHFSTKLAALVAICPFTVGCSNDEPAALDAFVGVWERNGEATFNSSQAHLLRHADMGTPEEVDRRMAEARSEILESPWTIAAASDGTLTFDARTRAPGTGELTDFHWVGTWKNDLGAVEMHVSTGAVGTDELTVLKGVLNGDRLTVGGPAGNPKGLVLEFDRLPE